MKRIIYYFSGTGNSLQVARELSRLLGESTVKAISGATDMDLSAGALGIVFPVHLWGVPGMVSRFIEKIQVDSSGKYFFAVATYKSQAGDVIGQLGRKMHRHGMKLSAGFTVPMPGNNILYYDVEPVQVRESKLKACENELVEIARSVASKREVMPAATLAGTLLQTGLLHRLLTNMLKNMDKQFWTDSRCTGCQACAKVCPSGNIKFVDSRPVWQRNCQQCLACINWCPHEAIQHGKSTGNKERYVNPAISISELFR